jgi:hypothetical protein
LARMYWITQIKRKDYNSVMMDNRKTHFDPFFGVQA